MKKNILAWIILIVSLFGLLYIFIIDSNSESSMGTSNNSETKLKVGDLVPIFQLKTVEGNEINSEIFENKPRFIMEWASWCPDCKEQMPIIQKMYEKYGDRAEFILVNLTDGRDSKENVEKYIKDNNYTIPYYYDLELSVKNQFGIKSIPTMYFVDSKGKVTDVYDVSTSEDKIENSFKKIM